MKLVNKKPLFSFLYFYSLNVEMKEKITKRKECGILSSMGEERPYWRKTTGKVELSIQW
jgi:hypothetical protein